MKVRIIKSEAWHTGMIGRVFNAKYDYTSDNGWVTIDNPGEAHHGNGLCRSDYEAVPESTVDDKIVKHEGVEYKVPGWAKRLTCDAEGKLVWAWEITPVWNVERQAYYNAAPGIGKHTSVYPYVRPKPAGCFSISI